MENPQEDVYNNTTESEENEKEIAEEADYVPIELTNFLFLGGQESLKHAANFKLTHLLNVANEIEYHHELKHLKLDYPGIFDPQKKRNAFFESCFAFVQSAITENESSKVLVHCMFGVNRSVTVVIALLMKLNSWNLKESYIFVKGKQPKAAPFPHELIDYERALYGKNSMSSQDFKCM